MRPPNQASKPPAPKAPVVEHIALVHVDDGGKQYAPGDVLPAAVAAQLSEGVHYRKQ